MKNKNKIIGAIVAVIVIAVGYVILSGKGTLLTGKITLKPSVCPGPYHVQTKEGRCVWSCGVGTQPDNPKNSAGQCVCQSGYVESATDRFGRRICELVSTTLTVERSLVPDHCTTTCERNEADEVIALTFISGGFPNASFRGGTDDGIRVRFWGDFLNIASIEGLPVELIDSSGNVKAIGSIVPVGLGPSGIGVGSVEAALQVPVGSNLTFTPDGSTYKIRVDTTRLIRPNTSAGEQFSVSVNEGGIQWYNEISSQTSIVGVTPFVLNYLY